MSIASPRTRDELRQYVLTKLGAPVLEINIAAEQMDIAINDAFQYWHGRSHIYGTERMYLTTEMTAEFVANFTSHGVDYVTQVQGPNVHAAGMVSEIQLVNPGSGYLPSGGPLTNAQTSNVNTNKLEITTQAGDDIETQAGDVIVYETAGTATGQGLTLAVGPERTTSQGLVTASVMNTGTGYALGDMVTVNGSNTGGTLDEDLSLWEITGIKTSSPVYGKAAIERQNNFLILPDAVVGVQKVLNAGGSGFMGGGIVPGGMIFPVLMGGLMGDTFACSGMGYNLTSYVMMREYMATLDFLFFPPIQYDFNPHTHRLFIDSNAFSGGDTGVYGSARVLMLECMVAPDPDVFPDCYNDHFVKEYTTALAKAQWGRNLTKYNQVQLPGGITINGDQILNDAKQEIAELRARFATDWGDYALDVVG